jgi:hypothetical protein
MKMIIAVVALGLLAWAGFSLYSQPLSLSRDADPVRGFLARALAGDSTGLAARAATPQPVAWALAAVREDSVMIRAWSRNRGRVKRTQHGDTVWITLSQNRSSPNCSFLGSLSAAMVGPPKQERLTHLSATCPRLARDSLTSS